MSSQQTADRLNQMEGELHKMSHSLHKEYSDRAVLEQEMQTLKAPLNQANDQLKKARQAEKTVADEHHNQISVLQRQLRHKDREIAELKDEVRNALGQQKTQDTRHQREEIGKQQSNPHNFRSAADNAVNSSGATSLSFDLSRDAREIQEMVEQMGAQLAQRLIAEASHADNDEEKQALLRAQQQMETQRQLLFCFLAQREQATRSMQQYYESYIQRLSSERDALYAREIENQNALRNHYLQKISVKDQRIEALQSSLKASQRQTSTYFQSYTHIKAKYDITVDQLQRLRASEEYLNARPASQGQPSKRPREMAPQEFKKRRSG